MRNFCCWKWKQIGSKVSCEKSTGNFAVNIAGNSPEKFFPQIQ
jgi:hypothetical protein